MSDLAFARGGAFSVAHSPLATERPFKDTDGLLQHFVVAESGDDELLELLSLCLLTARMEAGKQTGRVEVNFIPKPSAYW